MKSRFLSLALAGSFVLAMLALAPATIVAQEGELQVVDEVIAQIVASTTPSMPPRERTTLNRSVDIAIGRGHLASVRASVTSITPYITTGALQAAAAIRLIDGDTQKVGFASACQAFGHRYLLNFLEQRGLARGHVTAL